VKARGGDSDNIIRKLIEALSDLEQLRVEMKTATDASVDAANKCQADKVSVLMVLHICIIQSITVLQFHAARCVISAAI
jgi:hypothetical protein